MKYFSPTYWLQAGVAFLALQQAAQSAPPPIHKLLSKNDFKKLTPTEQREYMQSAEYVIYDYSDTKNPYSAEKVEEVRTNYNERLSEYAGVKFDSNHTMPSVIGKIPYQVRVYNITEPDDAIRQRNCPKLKRGGGEYETSADAIKCLPEGRDEFVRGKDGKNTYCRREKNDDSNDANKVLCSTKPRGAKWDISC